MATKNVKTLGKKALSLLLTLVMVTSMMQLTVFAAENPSAGSTQQIVTNGQETSYAGGKVAVSKLISGTDVENVFDITLSVKTTQTQETMIMTPSAAVALVMDTSQSMDNTGGDRVTRLAEAKLAAKDFVDAFADPNGAARYVSLSEFYRVGYAKGVGGKYWFNVSDEAERGILKGLIDGLVYDGHSGTNVEAGLLLAQDLLDDRTVSGLDHKFVLVLSDGAPNAVSTAAVSGNYVAGEYNGDYRGNAEWDKAKYDSILTDWAGYTGGGQYIYTPAADYPDGSEEHEAMVDTMDNNGYYMGHYYETSRVGDRWNQQTVYTKVDMTGFSNPYVYAAKRAADVARNITASGTPVYTINYGDANEEIGAHEANWNFLTGYSVHDWLKYHIASNTANAYGSGDSGNVAELFTSILDDIQNTLAQYAQAWTVTDPMGERVTYLGGDTNDGSASVRNGVLTWVLDDPTVEVEGSNTYYTYTMTYQVKLDNVTDSAAFAEHSAYAANGTTTLTYWLMVDENGNQYYVNENGAKIDGDPTLTAEFVVPSVEGYLADLSFTKVNEENAPLAGAQFTLSGTNGFSQTRVSGEDGTVSFTAIPSGYSYTLTEDVAPSGYDAAAPYTVTVAYDVLSVAGVNDLASFQIVNEESYIPVPPNHIITASKTVDGADLTADQFSFQLLDAEGNVLQTVSNAADGSVTFEAIDYAETGVGTYVYTVKEVLPETVPQGWTYDESVYTVTVVVSQDAETGEYSKAVTLAQGETAVDAISFTNTYEPPYVPGSITVIKTTNGNETPSGATFTLQKWNGETFEPVPGKVAMYRDFVNGSYTFTDLAEGRYQVVESNADLNYYDLTVTSGAEVELKGSDNTGTIEIANDYERRSGSLKLVKTSNALSLVPGETTFVVTNAAKEQVASVKYQNFSVSDTDSNAYYVIENLPAGAYTVTELAETAQIAQHDLVVSEAQTVTVDEGEPVEAVINNSYTKHPLGSLKLIKATVGSTTPDETEFTITGPNNYSTTVKYGAFNNDTFHVIVGLPLGEYTIVENAATAQVSGYHLDVTGNSAAAVIENGQTAEVTITNTYIQLPPTSVSGSFTVNFDKAVTGDAYTMNANDFTFILNDGTNDYTGSNAADGTVSIAVPFDVDLASETGSSASRTFTYTLTEQTGSISGMTYDDAGYNVVVEIGFSRANSLTAWSWNIVSVESELTETVSGTAVALTAEDGSVFTNRYEDGNGSLTIVKASNNADLIPAEAAFVVTNSENVTVASVQYKDFTDGQYTVNGLAPGTYTVTETGANTSEEYTVVTSYSSPSVEVVTNGTAQITVTNTYTAVPKAYPYYVVHEFWYSDNGGDYQYVGAGEPALAGTVLNNPNIVDVFNAQSATDTYDSRSYTRAAAFGYEEITVSGQLDQGNLTYTVKYYASGYSLGSLTILKSFSGLDQHTLAGLKNALAFVVTGPDGYEATLQYNPYSMKLENLIPGTYTVTEVNAEVGGGYELHAFANDADPAAEGWQVEVAAGSAPAFVAIRNHYESKIYNIWFDGGEHGDVAGLTEGTRVHQWYKYADADPEVQASLPDYDWSSALRSSGDPTFGSIYAGLVNDPLADDHGLVLYTLTWAQWMDWYTEMGIPKPGLSVHEGWESDKEFYMVGGTGEAYTDVETSMDYMNAFGTPDENGHYNVYYRARYTAEERIGELTLIKTAPVGITVPADTVFTVTNVDTGESASVTYAQFVGGSITLDLPEGEYTVTESGAGIEGYTWTYTVSYGGADAASVVKGEPATVVVMNNYDPIWTPGPGGSDPDPQPEPDPDPIEIPDEEVPLAEQPETEEPLEEIFDEEVPLANVPKTGDASALWMVLSVLSGTGLVVLNRKREEDEV